MIEIDWDSEEHTHTTHIAIVHFFPEKGSSICMMQCICCQHFSIQNLISNKSDSNDILWTYLSYHFIRSILFSLSLSHSFSIFCASDGIWNHMVKALHSQHMWEHPYKIIRLKWEVSFSFPSDILPNRTVLMLVAQVFQSHISEYENISGLE